MEIDKIIKQLHVLEDKVEQQNKRMKLILENTKDVFICDCCNELRITNDYECMTCPSCDSRFCYYLQKKHFSESDCSSTSKCVVAECKCLGNKCCQHYDYNIIEDTKQWFQLCKTCTSQLNDDKDNTKLNLGFFEWKHPDSLSSKPMNRTYYHKKCHINGENEDCIQSFLKTGWKYVC